MSKDKQNSIGKLIRNKFFSYIKSFRLAFWLLISVFFLLGEWLSIQKFPTNQTIIVLLSLLGIFSTGSVINIIYDKKIDIFARKPIIKIFSYISLREMFFISIFLSSISLFLLYSFTNFDVFLIGFIIVLIAIFYSTPPIRLKTKPPFDCITNALGGSLPFFIGWMILPTSFNFESVIYGSILFLFILHTFFFFTTSDIDIDKEMGIKTSCNILGLKNSIIVGAIIYVIALSSSIYFFEITNVLSVCLTVYSPVILLAILFKDNRIYLVNIVGGRSTSIFAGSILILLSIFSKDIFPIFFLTIWSILTVYDIFKLLKSREKIKK